MNKHEIDMSTGKLMPKLLRFSIPLILSSLLQLAFNAADLIVVGRFAGDNSLAAVGSNGPMVTLIVTVLVGVCTGTNVLVARYYGAKDREAVEKTVQTSILFAFVAGIVIGVVGFFVSKPLLKLMATPDEVIDLATLYLRIIFCSVPITATYNFAATVLRAVGDTKRPLYFLTIAGVLNVGMNLLFVIVLNMDVAGVALATVLSQVLSFILTLRCLIKTDAMYRLKLKGMRFHREQLIQLLKIGIPAGLQGSLFAISNMVIQSSVNSFGAVVMAGASAGANIENFEFCVQDSISQSAMASVSQNMGARKYDRTKKVVLCCCLLEFFASVIMCAFSITLRRQLVGIYTSVPEAIEAGATRLIVMGIPYFLNGLMHVMTGSLRGHGYGTAPTLITFMGICVFRVIWIATVFPIHHTLMTIYISYPISWIITGIVNYIFYFTQRNKAFAKNEKYFAEKEAM